MLLAEGGEEMFETRRGVVVACDVRNVNALDALVDSLKDLSCIVAYKIGFRLGLLSTLPAVTGRIKARTSSLVIYDHQKAGTDIPEMGSEFADVCNESGVDAAIIFPHAGPATLRRWLDAFQDRGVAPIVGAIITHPEYRQSEGGFIADDADKEVYRISLSKGVRDFVLPGTKPESARTLKAISREMGIEQLGAISPGFGRQGADSEVAKEAFEGISWSPVVGSAIYGAPDPAEAARTIASDLGLLPSGE